MINVYFLLHPQLIILFVVFFLVTWLNNIISCGTQNNIMSWLHNQQWSPNKKADLHHPVENVGVHIERSVTLAGVLCCLSFCIVVCPQDAQQPFVRADVLLDQSNRVHVAEAVAVIGKRYPVGLLSEVLGFWLQRHVFDTARSSQAHWELVGRPWCLCQCLEHDDQSLLECKRLRRHCRNDRACLVLLDGHCDVWVPAGSEALPCPCTILPRAIEKGWELDGTNLREVVDPHRVRPCSNLPKKIATPVNNIMCVTCNQKLAGTEGWVHYSVNRWYSANRSWRTRLYVVSFIMLP